jgi:DNA segregation ATPase FtsK/SpoIIIE, S-DNA-T family
VVVSFVNALNRQRRHNRLPSDVREPGGIFRFLGDAAGVIVILATQRPSHQVIDPSMRDLFSYRWAFRCTTDSSSDTVLGQGWAAEGYTAAEIDPLARGVGWLLSETGVPRRIKAAYLTDTDIHDLAAYAASLRGHQDAA